MHCNLIETSEINTDRAPLESTVNPKNDLATEQHNWALVFESI